MRIHTADNRVKQSSGYPDKLRMSGRGRGRDWEGREGGASVKAPSLSFLFCLKIEESMVTVSTTILVFGDNQTLFPHPDLNSKDKKHY